MADGTRVYYDERMMAHDMGAGHCECPQRLGAIVEALKAADVSGVTWHAPTPATREQLLRVHTQRHLEFLDLLRGTHTMIPDAEGRIGQRCAPRDSRLPRAARAPRTPAPPPPASIDAAYLAAGAAIDAVEAVMTGEAANAFAFVRPPGHHAVPDRAMGFCLLNNIAVAAAHAVKALGCARVAIIDWDVHHGNGTQDAFEKRGEVLFISLHQGHFYPGTGHVTEVGHGPGEGCTINLPLPPGPGDAEYLALMRTIVLPIARAYAPDLVLVSAGFDAHAADPLGGMEVSSTGFGAMCAMVRDFAAEACDGKIVLVLEGGYDLGGLATSAVECVKVLAGGAPPRADDAMTEAARGLVEYFRTRFERYWNALGH